jgi:methylated-DNA-[protein]-cysteine S-methyltransferase
MDYAPHIARLATAIGTVTIQGGDAWVDDISVTPGALPNVDAPAGSPTDRAKQQLREWFAGTRRDFDLPLRPSTTPRGTVLRDAIASVPYGETRTYGALAQSFVSSSRAVGQACRRNPFPIVIPCHRVTSAAGSAEHYSAGDGVTTKAWLIAYERSNILK